MHFSIENHYHSTNALVAQWLERHIGNVEVASSTLARGFLRAIDIWRVVLVVPTSGTTFFY